ncbi:unnamed protein product [Mesocestoides corti]|uniref:SCP domain-containing protein n=1 Tax=Mesocestoides corti TaxID=53468 RepID=A0A0R3U2S4_MESCO|nr:unnamed protein product [Mesocestoides corti]
MCNYSVELEQIAERYLSRCPDNHPDPLVDTEFNGTTMTIKSYSPYKPSVLEYLQDYQSSLRFCDSQHRHFAFCQSHRKMVWAQSTEVGCAIHFCGPARHSNYLIGCLYKPGFVYSAFYMPLTFTHSLTHQTLVRSTSSGAAPACLAAH